MQQSPCRGCQHETKSKRSWQPCVDCQLSGKPYKYADQYGYAGLPADYKPDLFGGKRMMEAAIQAEKPRPPIGQVCNKCGRIMNEPGDFVRNVKSLTGYLNQCRICFSAAPRRPYKKRDKVEKQEPAAAPIPMKEIKLPPLVDRILQKYPNIIETIKKQAEEQERTPEAQLVWIVRNALESCEGCIKQVHKFLIERDGESHGQNPIPGAAGKTDFIR